MHIYGGLSAPLDRYLATVVLSWRGIHKQPILFEYRVVQESLGVILQGASKRDPVINNQK